MGEILLSALSTFWQHFGWQGLGVVGSVLFTAYVQHVSSKRLSVISAEHTKERVKLESTAEAKIEAYRADLTKGLEAFRASIAKEMAEERARFEHTFKKKVELFEALSSAIVRLNRAAEEARANPRPKNSQVVWGYYATFSEALDSLYELRTNWRHFISPGLDKVLEDFHVAHYASAPDNADEDDDENDYDFIKLTAAVDAELKRLIGIQ